MEASDIKFGDWARVFVGEVPAEFYIELLLRGVFVYALLLFSMRALGKRMSAQLNRNELSALVSLAAAVGVPLQAPDRGLLPAVVVALVIICISRSISMLIYRSAKAERISQGNYAELVRNGVMQQREMRMVRITRERLFSLLRERGVRHLGEVRRLYFEAGASFTLLRREEPCPGLAVIPDWDQEYLGRQNSDPQQNVCVSCGTLEPARPESCSGCGGSSWTTPII